MKRISKAGIALVLVASMLLGGCGGGEKKSLPNRI